LLLAAVTPRGGRGDFARIRALVQACEQAGFDAVVLREGTVEHPGQFESTTLAAALTTATEHIGLIAGTAAGDLAPYHLGRITASLDHMSGGRTGWCPELGETADAAANGRLAEYIEVVRGLWDSFDDDAFVHDRADGRYWRLDGIHRLNHTGTHYAVAGPLNVARPPQGHPVVAVTGPHLAASADLVLLGPAEEPDARQRRAAVRRQAAAAGRDPDQIKVCTSLPAGGGVDRLLAGADQGTADGFLVPLERADDSLLAAVAQALGRRHPAGATTTLRGRLGLARPASRFARA
jgi:alkanesulfonate monooxygenase SsuD/methylene tetrahydromethanopterin reductase-like flavin-dependent oxidoreductase (luciferase family)